MIEMYLAGLLACCLLNTFPFLMNSGLKNQQFVMQLTATGIAPDLHRLPILIPLIAETNYEGKCREENFLTKTFCEQETFKRKHSFINFTLYRLSSTHDRKAKASAV